MTHIWGAFGPQFWVCRGGFEAEDVVVPVSIVVLIPDAHQGRLGTLGGAAFRGRHIRSDHHLHSRRRLGSQESGLALVAVYKYRNLLPTLESFIECSRRIPERHPPEGDLGPLYSGD
jgi:hypothetical protein